MSFSQHRPSTHPSTLMLSDRLLTLAEDADRAGCAITAEHLLELAYLVFDDAAPAARHPVRRAGWTGGFRPMGARPAIFARLPVPLSGLALQGTR
jgi:hypothetical protein